MTTIRNPAVAGMFYPGEAGVLRSDVDTMLADAAAAEKPPKAMIVPHAGYIYSGPVAATAYASLRAAHDSISTVVLLGPSHRVYFQGLAAPEADQFATPLGTIPVDQQRIDRLLAACPFVTRHAAAHAREHSLEVHLPFLQAQLDAFALIPLVVGDATPEQVEQAIDYLWGDAGTLIVISSDLSHYHDYATARRLDADTAKTIEALQPERLDGNKACGYLPVSGLLLTARRRGIRPERVDLRNSGDTAGPRDQVVGYGAWVLHETA
jgi:AmmeMemoRadiSam system protein B